MVGFFLLESTFSVNLRHFVSSYPCKSSHPRLDGWGFFLVYHQSAHPSISYLSKSLLTRVKWPLIPRWQFTSTLLRTCRLSSLAYELRMSGEAAARPSFQSSHPQPVTPHKVPRDTLSLLQPMTRGGLLSVVIFPPAPAAAFHLFVPEGHRHHHAVTKSLVCTVFTSQRWWFLIIPQCLEGLLVSCCLMKGCLWFRGF